jgi:pimeloyl-ACP methyl ester carboxylesterase
MPPGAPRPQVVLVHGYLAHRIHLSLLSRRLDREGFTPLNWGYPTVFRSLTVAAERLAATFRRLDAETSDAPLHLVTHSMGGIVARAALGLFRPTRLSRWVMLATPNRGSEVARRLEPFVGRLSPPVRELSTAESGLVHSIAMPAGVDIGVIAAGHDLLVTEASTRPDAPHEHVTIHCMHSSLLVRRDAFHQIVSFLRSGRFLEAG